MKKIITAINSPEINEELKKEEEFKIVGKDIQYREALLEILEKIKDINMIIIYEKILGKINIEELINKIKEINPYIDIIFFLDKEDENKRKILNRKNIKKVYIKSELNSKNLIKIINSKKIENKEVEEKNKICIKLIKIIKKYFNRENDKNKKIITIIGKKEVEKNIMILFFIKYLEKTNKKILIINFNKTNKELFFLLNEKNILNRIKNKKINYKEIKNKEELKKNIKKLECKINKNITCIFNINSLLKNISYKDENLKKEFVNRLFEIYNKKFDYIFISDSYIDNKEIKNQIIEKSNKIILNFEKNCIGIKELEEIIKNYHIDIGTTKRSLHIIMKYDKFHTISLSILKEIFRNSKNVHFTNFKNEYENYKKYKDKKIAINKKLKRKIKKIL